MAETAQAQAEADAPTSLTPLQAAEKIAARLSGPEVQKGDPEPQKKPPQNGEDTRQATPDPLEPEVEADLLPGEDEPETKGDEPEAEETRQSVESDDPLEDPLDDSTETLDGPLNFEDVASALEMDPKSLSLMEIPVRVNGKAQTATLEEVIKGYSRNADYLAKTEKLAEDRKAMEAKLAESGKNLAARLERFDGLMLQLEHSVIGDKAQLTESLLANDPDAYRRLELKIRENTQKFEEAARERVKAIQEDAAQMEIARNQSLAEHFQRLQREHPRQFGTPDVFKKTMGRLETFANKRYGISSEQFGQIGDSAHIEVLMDALRWNALKGRKPETRKRVKNSPKMGRSGRSSDRQEASAATRKKALGSLKRSGNIRDAAAALQKLGIV